MAEQGNSRANVNKAIRQEALRDQLSSQGHVQHVNDIAKKLLSLDDDLDQLKVTRLKAAADIKCKLIAKYLPDLKSIELSGETDLSEYSEEEILRMINEYQASTNTKSK